MKTTTLETLAQMIMQFDDKKLEEFYQRLVQASPEFKAQYVDKIVSLLVKIERLFKQHQELEELHQKLQFERIQAEDNYNEWERTTQNAKNLSGLIESEPKVKHAFSKLMELTTSNKFLDQEGIDALIQAEKTLDEKIAFLHEKQIQINREYIKNSWHSHRKLSRVLRDLSKHVSTFDHNIILEDPAVYDKAAEKIVLELCELFRQSFKPTPTGYHHIQLNDFTALGVKAIMRFLNTENEALVKNFAQEALTELYEELVDFHGTFHGTQQEISTTVQKREAMTQNLSTKMQKLQDIVAEYVQQLERFAREPIEIETYASRNKVMRTPKPPPSLRRS